MSAQPEALRLADALDKMGDYTPPKAAAELRRQHAVIAEMLAALKWMVENDETMQGDEPVDRLNGATWNEENAYWIDGLNKAIAAIAKAEGHAATQPDALTIALAEMGRAAL